MGQATALRDLFEAAKVAQVAIVDDGYDRPGRSDINADVWPGLVEAFEVEEGPFKGIEIVSAPGDATDAQVAAIYEVLIAHQEKGGKPPAVIAAAQAVLSGFLGKKQAKLGELAHIEEMALQATGKKATQLGSRIDVKQLVKFDLIFLDFYLGEETTDGVADQTLIEKARAHAKTIIQATMAEAVKAGGRTPLFVLISSTATEENVPLFRDEAALIRSKFRFLQKSEFKVDRSKTDYVLSDLVSQRDAADAIEQLLMNWQEAVASATEEMMMSARRLDVVDYSYLQQFRLAEEKVSLLEYLTWLFNSYLGSFVERKMASTEAATLKSLTDSAENTPPSLLRPFGELPRIYNDITTTTVQGFDGAVRPTVWTGDMYVKKKFLTPDAKPRRQAPQAPTGGGAEQAGAPDTVALEAVVQGDVAVAHPDPKPEAANPKAAASANEAEKTQEVAAEPDILAVISPVCDLVPGRIKTPSIIMMGGTLSKLGTTGKASPHFIVLDPTGDRNEEDALPYQIQWNEKWPVTRPFGAFDGNAIKGTDYVRTGRLRDLYAAELAGMMSGQLSKVGLPLTPPFSHPLEVRVIYRAAGQVRMLTLPATELAWEIYPVRTADKRSVVIADDLVWAVRDAARNEIADKTSDAFTLLSDPAKLRPLTKPFPVRGSLVELSGKSIQVERLESFPAKAVISARETQIIIQFSGPMKKSEK